MKDKENKSLREDNVPPDEKNAAGEKFSAQSRKFIWIYAIALFSVAFVFILLSYLSQLHTNDTFEALSGQIKKSVMAAEGVSQKVEALMAVVEEQKEENDRLTRELDDASQKIVTLTEEIESQKAVSAAAGDQVGISGKKIEGLELMWKLESAYRQKRTSDARKLIKEIDDGGYADTFSPEAAEEYAKIKKALIK